MLLHRNIHFSIFIMSVFFKVSSRPIFLLMLSKEGEKNSINNFPINNQLQLVYSNHSWQLPNSKITPILLLLDIFRRSDRVKCYYSPSMMHFVFPFWAGLVKVGSMLSCVSGLVLILKTAYWPLPLPFAIIHQTNSGALSELCCNWWNGFYAWLACCFGASSGRKPCGKLDRWLDKKLVV